MTDFDEGMDAADTLGRALFELGFPYPTIGDVGLKFADHLEAESRAEGEFLRGVRAGFEGFREGSQEEIPRDFRLRISSEWGVVTDLLDALRAVTQDEMPDSIPPAYEILDLYDSYLESSGAAAGEIERASRLRRGVSDVEDRATRRI